MKIKWVFNPVQPHMSPHTAGCRTRETAKIRYARKKFTVLANSRLRGDGAIEGGYHDPRQGSHAGR